MRILLAGDFRWDRLAASYGRAFQALGHEVVPFDLAVERRSLARWMQSRYGYRLTLQSLAARRRGSLALNRLFIEEVQTAQPDLVWVLNGDFIMPETVRMIRASGVCYAMFHADNPFPPHYNSRPETIECARECDVYFIWSYRLVDKLGRNGVNAQYLPFAWDPEVFPHQHDPGQEVFDVIFVGGWDARREAFLSAVAEHFPLKIWGPSYWATRSRARGAARRCWQGKALTGPEAASVFARSKITLNIYRDQHYIDGVADGTIMRSFEAPGSGSFLLAPRSRGATEVFPEGESGAYFDDLADALRQIEHYLGRSDERHSIGQQANAIVVNHRYVDRARQILHHVEEAL